MKKRIVPVTDTILTLNKPGAELYIIQKCPRIILGSRQVLVNKPVLQKLRELGLINPFETVKGIQITRISEYGQQVAKMKQEAGNLYSQLPFEELCALVPPPRKKESAPSLFPELV
jgi:hypothetical protein